MERSHHMSSMDALQRKWDELRSVDYHVGLDTLRRIDELSHLVKSVCAITGSRVRTEHLALLVVEDLDKSRLAEIVADWLDSGGRGT